jgi:iron complex outermembrane receptor protein
MKSRTARSIVQSLAVATFVTAAGLVFSGAACAQDANTNAAPAADQAQADTAQGAATDTLQEVVVTAERRAANLQTTPISIQAVSGTQLQQLHLNSVQSLQVTVPNFTVNDNGGQYESYNIRGIGNTAITPSITTGVAVFRDGLLLSETIGQNVPLYDIRDTEVLEGPQGTFVGASSTGGAIQINSQDPNFRGINGYGAIEGGTYSLWKSDGALNVPISNTFAARLAYDFEGRNSFYGDEGSRVVTGPAETVADPGHYNSRNVRIGLLWKPTTDFQALLKAEYNYVDQGWTGASPNQLTYTTLFNSGGVPGNPLCTTSGNVLSCPLPGTVSHSQYYAYSTHVPFQLNYDPFYNTMETNTQMHDGLELRYTLPNGVVLRSLSGFQSIDIHNVNGTSNTSANAGVAFQEIGPHDNYYSEEFNIISPVTGPFYSKFNYIAGAFWYYRNTPVLNYSTSVNPPYDLFQTPSTQAFISYASVQRILGLYGQANWQFARTLQLTLGARENWDNNFNYLEGPSGIYSYPNGPTGTTGLLAPFPVTGHYSDDVPTGKVGLNWTPVQGQFFYVFYARGYKSGGVSVSPGALPSKPENVNDYELGWKGTLLNGHLQTQVGGYWMDYRNMQYQIFDITEAQGLTVANLAPSTIKGVSFSMQARVAHLGINLGAAYNDSSLGALTSLPSYRLPPGFNTPVPHVQCGAPLAATSTAACFNYLPYEETVSGEQLPFAPKLTGHASLDYAIPVGANGSFDPRITYTHTDRQWVSIFQDSPYNLLPSRDLWSLNLDYVVNQWTVSAYSTNLFNKVYLSGTDGGNNVFYGAPRQIGMRVVRTF